MATSAAIRGRIAYGLFWIPFGVAIGWFVWESVADIVARQAGDAPQWRLPLLLTHGLMAIVILGIAPFQFSSGFRSRYQSVHRWMGRIFLTFAIVAAALAIALGITYENPPARVPLALFGAVWAFVSLAAWACARSRDFANHRKFMFRSFAIATAFVWIRLLSMVSDTALGFIDNDDARGATREWLCFVVPLLAVELWLGWWAAFRTALSRMSSGLR